jgi:hypothetical protein
MSKNLMAILRSDAGKAQLEKHGLSEHDLGMHSYRKGPATYAATGTTSGVSEIAIHLRGGWAVPDITGRYEFLGEAQDTLLARILAGRPS